MLNFTVAEKAAFGGRNPEILLQALNEIVERMVAEPWRYRLTPAAECYFEGTSATEIIQRRADPAQSGCD